MPTDYSRNIFPLANQQCQLRIGSSYKLQKVLGITYGAKTATPIQQLAGSVTSPNWDVRVMMMVLMRLTEGSANHEYDDGYEKKVTKVNEGYY